MKIPFNFKAKGLQQTPKRGNRTFDQMAESDDYCLLTVQEIELLQKQLARARKTKRSQPLKSEKLEEESKKTPHYKEDWKARLQGIA